jgi:hypothetical protein
LLCCYELEVDGVDVLGVEGADSPLLEAELSELLFAAFRPRNPRALPFGCPRRRRVR